MIDTDKYEDGSMVALLIAEVKQLRGLLRELADAYAAGNEEQVETLVYEIYGDFGEDD